MTLSPRRLKCAALVGMTLAVVGCDCGEKALVGVTPKIQVTPDPIVVSSATVGTVGSVPVNVKNIGTAALIISETPTVIDVTGSIQFDVTSVFVDDCTGKERQTTTSPMTIEAGECAQLQLRYLPSMDGTATGKLEFLSNDVSMSPLDVPITVSALTPHIQACDTTAATQPDCNTDGNPLGVTFGTAPIEVDGGMATQTIQLNSLGTKAVVISSAQLTGDPDFSISPGTSAFNNKSIASMQSQTVTLTFKPLLGGPRTATLVFDTDDPLNPALTLNIIGQGDGPALCYCIGTSATSCENTTPTANFSQVGVNTTSVLNIYLNDCGTEPLIFNSAMLTGNPPFSATSLPASGTTLAPQQTIAIPITFAPTVVMPYTGSLGLVTADGEHPFFTLQGTGVNSGCNLQPEATVLDFGQVATGQTATQQFVVANTGTQPCYFPMPPAITAQSTPNIFAVATYPLQALNPSQTASIGVTYKPVGSSGTDMGTMTVYYADAASGAPTMPIPVALKGEPVATPTCKLETNPNAQSMFGGALNFGDVGIDRPKTLPVVIRNVGSATCNLSKATIFPGLFSILPGATGPVSAFTITGQPANTLAPGASTQVTVQFLPMDEEQYGSPFGMIGLNIGGPTVQVQTSDTTTFNGSACNGGSGTAGCAAWGLSGQGVISTIEVLPGQLDFGDITLSCASPQQTVTIYNVGNSSIQITGFSIDPAPPPTIFSVTSVQTPFTIAAGGSKSVTVTYTPTMQGIQSATLYIESPNAVVSGGVDAGAGGNNPYYSVPLTGTGVTTSMQTDTFTQLTSQQVDVLWDIDQDSNSMGDKQQQIATNAMSFMQAAMSAHTDYHLGVISNWDYQATPQKSSNWPSATVTPATLFKVSASEPNLWVEPTDPNPAMEFAQNVMIGTTDSATGAESGLQAMYQALSAPIINAANSGFLRDTATLVVISISDDDDTNSPFTPQFYAAFLQSLKPGNPSAAIFDTVGGTLPNGCNDPAGDGSDDAPTRYSQVSQATGGQLYNMCTGNWSQIAADLSLGSFGGQTHFVLSRPCNPSTLTVTVTPSGGSATVQTMGTQYTFDPTLNAINFSTSYIPPPGSTITATYDTLCL